MVKPRRKKLVLVLVTLLVLLAALVVMAPTLVNMGLFRGSITRAIEARVNGTVSIDRLGLGWTGPQTIGGFRVRDAAKAEAMNLDVTLEQGLLRLIAGAKRLDAQVAGRVRGELREDGSISLEDLVRPPPGPAPGGGGGAPGGGAGGTGTARPLPEVSITLAGLAIELHDAVRDEAISMADVRGGVIVRPGGESTVELESPTEAGARRGRLKLTGSAARIIAADGAFTPVGARANLNLLLEAWPVPLMKGEHELRALDVRVDAADLAQRLECSVRADAVIDGSQPGTLTGDLVIENLFDAAGSVTFDPGRVAGTLTGRNVPAAPIQRWLAATPIVLMRDVGESIDLEARFVAGERTRATVRATGPRATLDLAATIDRAGGAMDGERFTVTAPAAHPDLVAGLTGLAVDRPVDVNLALTSFRVPPVDPATGARPLADYALQGTLTMNGPVAIGVPTAGAADPPVRFQVERTVVNAVSARLRDGIHVAGLTVIQGGELTLDEHITGLFDARGALAAAAAMPAGRLTLAGLPAAVVANAVAADRRALIESLLGERIDLEITTKTSGEVLQAEAQVRSGGLEAQARAERDAHAVRVEGARVSLPITPALLDALQSGAPEPVRLTEAGTATVEIESLSLPWSAPATYRFADAAASGRISAPRLVLDRLPALVEPLGLDGLEARFTVRGGERAAISVEGAMTAARPQRDRSLAAIAFTLEAERPDGTFSPALSIRATDLAIPRLERMLGREDDAISRLLGESGSITVNARSGSEGQAAQLVVALPNLRGAFAATADPAFIGLTTDDAELVLKKEWIEERLNPPAPQPARTGAPGRAVSGGGGAPAGSGPSGGFRGPLLRVASDVPVRIALRSLRLPRGLIERRAFDPAAFRLSAELGAGRIEAIHSDDQRAAIDAFRLVVQGDNLARGVDFTINGRTESGGGVGGEIRLNGRLTDLVSDTGTLEAAKAKLDVQGAAQGVPTALADALMNMQGLLTAAVGPMMALTITAERFSTESGRVDLRVETTNGFLAARAAGGAKALHIAADDPLRAELAITPPLRQRLLERLHPIFADVRTTEQSVRATVSGATLPADGDVSRLQADIGITVGRVEFDSGSTLLTLLKLANQMKDRKTIPGSIEPVIARVRGGVVTYERFAIRIDKHTMVYAGSIDLNTRRVDLRTEIPLEGLAMSVEELRDYADKIVVPLVTRGELGNLKTEIDPSFDLAGAALEAGFRGLLTSPDSPLQDLLNDLLRKGEKK